MTSFRSRRADALVLMTLAAAACGDGSSTEPVAPPNAPSSLTAVANTTTQVTLHWVLPAGRITEVKIERATGSGPFVELTAIQPATGSYVDTGLSPSTAYKYHVRACNGSACSPVSEVAVSTPAFTGQTPLAVWNAALPPGLAGYAYAPTLRTSGGTGGDATWRLVSGSLPPGVSFHADGTFEGSVSSTGSYPITVEVTAGGETAQKSFTIRVVAYDASRFNITRMDVRPVSPELEPHVQAAIDRWEQAITGDLHIDTIPPGFFKDEASCGGFGAASNGTFLDDILLIVNIGPLDGNVLGQASVCGIRYDNELPAVGVLTLNATVLSSLAGTQTLTNILFHEIAHTLGYGILWYSDRLRLVPATECVSLERIGTPHFVGAAAVKEWQDAGGTGNPPIETEGGAGTACSHWKKSSFKTELMTGFVEPVGTAQPLSRITLASMADMGYTVDYRAANSYRVPTASPPALGVPSPWADDLWGGFGAWEIVQGDEPILRLGGTDDPDRR